MLCTTKDQTFSDKIADFGLAKLYKPGMEIVTPCGTSGYVAPEKIPAILEDGSVVTNPYGKSVDIWSIGCIVYFLLVGRPPFYAKTEEQMNTLVLRGKWNIPEDVNLSEAAKEFMAGLLQPQPSKRFTAKQALHHKWLKDTPTTPTELEKTLSVNENVQTTITDDNLIVTGINKISQSDEELKLYRNSLNAAIDSQRDGVVTIGAGMFTKCKPCKFYLATQSALWKKRQQKAEQKQQPL